MKFYYVYLMASRSRVLYTGITNDLHRRVQEHKSGAVPGFTKRYRANRLVYYEEHSSVRDAIHREKEIKGWRREKKVGLVERLNPTWRDLSSGA